MKVGSREWKAHLLALAERTDALYARQAANLAASHRAELRDHLDAIGAPMELRSQIAGIWARVDDGSVMSEADKLRAVGFTELPAAELLQDQLLRARHRARIERSTK